MSRHWQDTDQVVASRKSAVKKSLIFELFQNGDRPIDVFRKVGKSHGLSYPTVWRLHQEWKLEQSRILERSQIDIELSKSDTDTRKKSSESVALTSNGPANKEFADDEGVVAAPVRGGKMVERAGGLLLVAMIASSGLYEAAMRGWDASARWRDRLRMAIDAVGVDLIITCNH